MDAGTSDPTERRDHPRTAGMGWWIAVLVTLQIAAWAAWFIVAHRTSIAEVPIAPAAATTSR